MFFRGKHIVAILFGKCLLGIIKIKYVKSMIFFFPHKNTKKICLNDYCYLGSVMELENIFFLQNLRKVVHKGKKISIALKLIVILH
jgi:hypothetical protein